MNRIKHYRVAARMTQKTTAEAIGMSLEAFAELEKGPAYDIQGKLPGKKLKKLATILDTSSERLIGTNPPDHARLYNDKAPEDLQYFGEVAIHFRSATKPLVLSISEEAREDILEHLEQNFEFIVFQDLGNRTVIVRKNATTDISITSEALDTYGPEHHTTGYELATPIQCPDTRDWAIIAALAHNVGTEDFADAHVERVSEMIDAENSENPATKTIFELATTITYQFSNGPLRRAPASLCEAYDLYLALHEIIEETDSFAEEDPIIIPVEGYHHTVHINADAIDYLSIPTHILEEGRDEFDARLIEGLAIELANDAA